MVARGRPRIFVTLAEKQKAYRDRKRQESALRNSPVEQLSQETSETNELEVLWEKVTEIAKERNGLVANFIQLTQTDDGFHMWDRRVRELADQWQQTHSEWYMKWKAASYPVGSWTEDLKAASLKTSPAKAHRTL